MYNESVGEGKILCIMKLGEKCELSYDRTMEIWKKVCKIKH